MESILITIFLFVLNALVIFGALPSSEIIDNLKVKNSIKNAIINYYRNILQEISNSKIANITFHIELLLGLFAIGFSIFTANNSILIVFVAAMNIVSIIKDIMLGEDYLKKEKINNQLVISLLLMFSLKIASSADNALLVLPVINLLVISILNTNKNKYHFEQKPSLIFIDKFVFSITLFSQSIILLKEYLREESLLSVVVLSSFLFISQIYILEMLTIGSIVKRRAENRRITITTSMSGIILIMLFIKIWNNV